MILRAYDDLHVLRLARRRAEARDNLLCTSVRCGGIIPFLRCGKQNRTSRRAVEKCKRLPPPPRKNMSGCKKDE